MLMSETRIHSHDQHLIKIRKYFFQHRCWSSWVNGHSSAFCKSLNTLHRTVQIVVTFPMNEKRCRAGLGELFEEKIRIRNHQVSLERQTRDSAERMHNRRSDGDVGDEMSVHHI